MRCLLHGKSRGTFVNASEKHAESSKGMWENAREENSPSMMYNIVIRMLNKSMLEVFPLNVKKWPVEVEQIAEQKKSLLTQRKQNMIKTQ